MLLTHTKRGWRKSRVLPDVRLRSAYCTRISCITAQEATEEITYAANALNQYTQIDTNGSDFTPEYDANGNQTLVKTGTGIPASPQEVYAVTGWYITWDLKKNICEVYGPSGFIRTTYTYTSYGSATADGDVEQAIQWSSEMHDTELAHVYYNYRYYNPTDGRWTRRDPIGIEGSVNLYTYVRNNSLLLFDYLGSYATTLDELGPYELEIAAREAIEAVIQMAEALALNSSERCKNCKPCIPEIGTLMYRIDMEGRTHFCKSTKSCADKGHTHYFIVQQTPYSKCKCIAPELRKYTVPGKHAAHGIPYMKPTGGGPAL